MTVLFEPASAIAGSICIAARTLSSVARHPRPCGWCDYSVEELRSMVEGFNAWAGYDERRGTYRQFDASVFQGLPHAEQRRQIEAAQAFEPLQVDPPPPADVAEEGPSWMRS